MGLPTSPFSKYFWGATVITGSLVITVPLLYSDHPWAFGFIYLLVTAVLSWQLLLIQLPDILKARGQMHLNISKGQSLLLNASSPAELPRIKAPRIELGPSEGEKMEPAGFPPNGPAAL